MYEVYRRNFESPGLRGDGLPLPEREVEGTFLKNVLNITELDSTFRVLTTAAAIAGREEEFIARDRDTGSWLEPDDVIELLQQGPAESDDPEELAF